MRFRHWLIAAVPLVLVAGFMITKIPAQTPAKTLPAQGGATPPPTAITNALATMPSASPTTLNQFEFDLFAWLEFIAANWPADTATCGPDSNKSILDGTGPVVWETYLQPSDIFVTQGQPAPWCAGVQPQARAAAVAQNTRIPAAVRELAARTGVYRFLHQSSKMSSQLAQQMPGMEQALGGPLTDQNGRWARYEIRVNQDEYNYIIKNNLWNNAGRKAFPGGQGAVTLPAGPTQYGPTGAMEFKAAWKVLGRGDNSARFYKIQAIVYNDDTNAPSPGQNPVTLGLVGLHITHKTASQPNWVWATFEQVDNLTSSFYNASSQTPPNVQLAKTPYTELAPDGQPLNTPTQVTRLNPINDPSADALNKIFRGLLGNSVWANYQLVSTQWSSATVSPIPGYLANTTMETYAQEPSPPADYPAAYPGATYNAFATNADPNYPTNQINLSSSSCLKCHGATTSGGIDFTFIFPYPFVSQ
jgi:hypothetical protein